MSTSTDRLARWIRRTARVAFVSAFLVVLAGSIVRMTGSGMGCPDWPRCFGLTIPPTEDAQVRWQPDTEYGEGRMILERDSLWIAPTDHLSGTSFDADRATGLWSHYTRHDYAHFNPFHTWVEFINRLLGAFAGLPALLLVGLSLLAGIRHRWWRPLLPAVGALLALGFVAWLGKKVVDGNLIPGSITLHMLGALAILGLQLVTLRAAGATAPIVHVKSKRWIWGATLLALAQLVFGTQVREAVDHLVHEGVARSEWLDLLPEWWKGHRTAFWAVLGGHLVWLWPGIQRGRLTPWEWAVLALLAGQFATGLAFGWLGMPAAAQPIHLVLAVGLILTDGWLLGSKPQR